MRMLIALVCVALLGACETVKPVKPASDVRITLERGPCFGFCPIYSVAIAGNGVVTYRGQNFVHVTGEQHATASAADVAHLVSMLEAAHFFELRDSYRANITDLPTYRVTYQRGDETKTVEDYAGGSAGMPQAVHDIELEIDRVAQTAQWVGQPGENRPQRGK